METITIRGKKWIASRITQLGISVISELPGELIGATLLTKGRGRLQVLDASGTEVFIDLTCREGQQKVEKILPEPKKHQGFCIFLDGEGSSAGIYHKPLDVSKSIDRIQEILETEFPAPWIHCHKFNLDIAKIDLLINEFPSRAGYLYVQECSGTVTLKFDSQNSPVFTLAGKDSFCWPVFEQLYLTWTAQAGKKVVLYVSNREIKRSTLA